MVATVDELLQIVATNPFIDGIGYFIEVTTKEPVDNRLMDELNGKVQHAFCDSSQVTNEGGLVLGFDFHDHLPTQGEEGQYTLDTVRHVLNTVDDRVGIDHLCIEFQFDMARAKRAQTQMDELLQP